MQTQPPKTQPLNRQSTPQSFKTSSPTLTQTRYPATIGVGLDFYGAGNIGDDLMVAGFLQALNLLQSEARSQVYVTTKWDINSQRRRFPEFFWIHRAASHPGSVFDPTHVDCWAGVGDTPFQLTSGEWSLNFLLSQLETIQQFRLKSLVSVGAETEIMTRAADFARIAQVFDRLSTRDEHSYRIITEHLQVPSDRVFCGADLANISLPQLLQNRTIPREFALGLIIAGDTLSNRDIQAVGRFIKTQQEPLAFIAGETRLESYAERGVLAKLNRFPWSRVGERAVLRVPNYQQGSLYDLVHPICACETVITTRYHGLLTAAWAGCKVAAVGRSSKVSALAAQLGVPHCDLPLTADKLTALHEAATIVPVDRLQDLQSRALESVAFALQQP